MHTADSCINIHEIQTNINIYIVIIYVHIYIARFTIGYQKSLTKTIVDHEPKCQWAAYSAIEILAKIALKHMLRVCVCECVCVYCTHMKLINIMKMQCTSAVPLLESPLVSGSPSFCSCHNNYKNTHMHTECPLLTHCWLWLQFYNT